MKTKTITSEELGKWLVTLYKFSNEKEYREQLHALRCVFGAEADKEFWNEACEYAKVEMNK